jgi:uncharacterized membrane protein
MSAVKQPVTRPTSVRWLAISLDDLLRDYIMIQFPFRKPASQQSLASCAVSWLRQLGQRHSLFHLMLVSALSSIWLMPSPSAAASFQALGDLPGGMFNSEAWAVSDDGTVVVGSSVSALGSEAFRWTSAGGMQRLGDGQVHSYGYDISGDGEVVVGVGHVPDGSLGGGFRWTNSGGMQWLDNFNGNAISTDGLVIVGAIPHGDHNSEAYRWTSSGGQGLGFLSGPPSSSNALAVSDDGAVIVGLSEGQAFRWTDNDGMRRLSDLPEDSVMSIVSGVSGDGSVVAGTRFTDSGVEAYRWTMDTGMQGLGDFAGGPFYSSVSGVSGDGSVIVGHASVTNESDTAFIWDVNHGMRDFQKMLVNDYELDLTGWRLNVANVSADGRTFVGNGLNPDGQFEAWIARISLSSLLPGDTNDDGIVDLNDLNNVRNNFGLSGDNVPGDTNGDGVIDLRDLNAVRNNFGRGGSPVPEPSSLALAFSAALLIWFVKAQ